MATVRRRRLGGGGGRARGAWAGARAVFGWRPHARDVANRAVRGTSRRLAEHAAMLAGIFESAWAQNGGPAGDWTPSNPLPRWHCGCVMHHAGAGRRGHLSLDGVVQDDLACSLDAERRGNAPGERDRRRRAAICPNLRAPHNHAAAAVLVRPCAHTARYAFWRMSQPPRTDFLRGERVFKIRPAPFNAKTRLRAARTGARLKAPPFATVRRPAGARRVRGWAQRVSGWVQVLALGRFVTALNEVDEMRMRHSSYRSAAHPTMDGRRTAAAFGGSRPRQD